MKGRLPKSLEALPQGVREVSDEQEKYHVATWPTQPLAVSNQTSDPASQDVIDSIVEPDQETILRPRPRDEDGKRNPADRPVLGLFERIQRWIRDKLLIGLLVIGAFAAGVLFGRSGRKLLPV
jgi:hypothetical protein